MVTLPNGTTSAFVGQPPNTERDYYIVKGFLRAAGLGHVDPALGYTRAAKPPSPDYTYASKQPGILAGLIIIIVAITTATVTRLILRASMSQMRFGPDDWATMAAGAFGLTYTVCQLIMALRGGGNHIWDATYEDYNAFNYYGTLDKWIFYVTVGFVKLSLAFFIRRLADRTSRWWRWFCDIFIATIVVYIGLAVFWEIFACTPLRAQWDRMYAGQLAEPVKCYHMVAQGRILNIAHVVQGVILLLSPMVILWSVKMNRAKKIRLFVIWGTGAVAVLCGLMRMIRADFTADLMWDYAELLIWTSLDVCIGIITISLPVMDAWLANAWKGAVTRLGGRSGYHGAGSGQSYGHGTAIKSATSSAPKNKTYSESVQEIMSPDAHEMRIFTTHEFNVRYSAGDADFSSSSVALPAKHYNKARVTGVE